MIFVVISLCDGASVLDDPFHMWSTGHTVTYPSISRAIIGLLQMPYVAQGATEIFNQTGSLFHVHLHQTITYISLAYEMDAAERTKRPKPGILAMRIWGVGGGSQGLETGNWRLKTGGWRREDARRDAT